jgi:hypothetical protein
VAQRGYRFASDSDEDDDSVYSLTHSHRRVHTPSHATDAIAHHHTANN